MARFPCFPVKGSFFPSNLLLLFLFSEHHASPRFRPITFLSRLVVLPSDGEQKQVGPFNVSRVPDCCCLIKHSTLEMPGKKAFCVINKFLFPPPSFVVCGRRRRRGVESIVSSVSGHEDLERTRPRHY